MAGFGLHHFVTAGKDFERAQYAVLDGIAEVRRAFSRSEIYPQLGDLITLHHTLRTIISSGADIREALPRALTHIDLRDGALTYRPLALPDPNLEAVAALMRWAMPYLEEAMEEGRTIFDFVEENLHVEEVGLVPLYKEEGYVIIPDWPSQTLQVLQYTLSLITRAGDRFRTLRTTHVKQVPAGSLTTTPQQLKRDLLAEQPQLPNPATFYVDAEIDFPFEQTLLPVAKRKLMQHLCAPEGAA